MTVQPASLADLPDMLRLTRALAREHSALDVYFEPHNHWMADLEEAFRDRLTRPEHLLGVAREGVVVLGMVTVALQPPPVFRLQPRAILENLVVAPHHRRQGVGRALVRAAQAWCDERGVVYLDVMVAGANAAAVAFWQAVGFDPVMLRLTQRRGGVKDERSTGPASR
ncbi:MAG: GNAT family N-acetyltransferase [Fimbriimonadaceae bacterium]|nr:GNAT family N-acetyltransferase [Fimbriimonadaceae bacterium]